MLPGEKRGIEGVAVGDKLAVFGGYSRSAPSKIVTVQKVLKQYVECDDGSKWDLHGWRRPRENGYSHSHVERYREEHGQAIRRERLVIEIRNWADGLGRERGKDVTLETLEAVAAAAKIEE